MDLNFSAFREPRGVMRVLHLVFSICAFATITGYAGHVIFKCPPAQYSIKYDYPFQIHYPDIQLKNGNVSCTTSILGDFSSDAKFFVATGVLAMLYSLAISIIYVKFDQLYKSNNQIPLVDFVITVIFGVLWLSSSAAWANGLSGLKSITDANRWADQNLCCPVTSSNYSSLNISVILGFLNFFLWAADLWFLYKETTWFQGNQPDTTSGV